MAELTAGPRHPRVDAAPRRATIREVAHRAKVSVGTVSNVLNRPEAVSPATRERVFAAIEEVGFVRSLAAHELRAGRSHSIGVVILDVSNPFFTEMVRGAESVLIDQGYVLVLCSSDESAPREGHYLRVLEEHRVEGLLISPVERELRSIEALRDRGTPTVLLDRRAPRDSLCSVTVDDVRGGELAAGHLLGRGHRQVVLLNGPLSIRQCADRRRGARRAARRAGLLADEAVLEVTVPSLTAEQGEQAAAGLLDLAPRTTAVMCANDLLALGLLKGLAAKGVRVPDDVAVVGYDDVAFSSMLSPALTSVRQPKSELGSSAALLLLEELRSRDHEHQVVTFEPELVVRASSGGGPTS